MTTTLNVAGRTRRYTWADGKRRLGVEPSAGTVTITGAGFGTLDLSKVFSSSESLSGLADGAQVPVTPIDGFFSQTTGARLAVYMEDGAKNRVSGSPVILCENSGDSNGPANSTLVFDYGSGIPEGTKVFWSSWDRFTAKAPDTLPDGQWKLRRLGSHNDIVDLGSRGDTNGSEIVLFRTKEIGGNNAINYVVRTSADPAGVPHFPDSGTTDNINQPQLDDQWRRIDQRIVTGTYTNADGDVSVLGHYPDSSAPPALLPFVEYVAGVTYPAAEKVYAAASNQFRYFIHQNFFGNGISTYPMSSYGGEVRHDDIYICVGSFKRVELCNSATYSASTHNEILYPTAWADGSVTAKVRTSKSSGTYYAHVIGENDTSLGYEAVTI